MTLEEFQGWQAEHWRDNSSGFHNTPFYLASCAQGEAGEIFRIVKRRAKVQETSRPMFTEEDELELVDEIGDTIHYCVRLLNVIGYTAEDALQRNKAKLIERYGN